MPETRSTPRTDGESDPRPRIVLDTNTVLALWMFRDPMLEDVRRWIETGGCLIHSREDALEELRRVLAYRQFGLAPEAQETIHAGYVARLSQWHSPEAATELSAALPRCRDTDDQKFLEIARLSGSTLLVSRDKALLRLSRTTASRHGFAIRSPERLRQPDQRGD